MSELHFCRIRRSPGEAFYDPEADIKAVFRQFMTEIPSLFAGLGEEKVQLLYTMMKVFITRLEEDPLPLDQQLDLFQEHFKQGFSEAERRFIKETLASYLFYVFALYQRRDGASDKLSGTAFNTASGLLTMRLKTETYAQVKQELTENARRILENMEPQVTEVNAQCPERPELNIRNIKEIVAAHVGLTGGRGWTEAAQACDRYFVKQESSGTDASIAAALAYPDYSLPCYSVTVNRDDNYEQT